MNKYEKKDGVVKKAENGRVYTVEHEKTVEVRCEERLAEFLREKYESVMESRYFGRGGIEVVKSGQMSEEELDDLRRLSYNITMTMEMADATEK